MPHAAGLYYELHGPEDGEPLLLSPGLGGSASYWQPNLAAFAERFRVILYDHRGTGRSDRALPDMPSVEEMAQDALGLLDALGIARAHFLGHALGGLIGMALALAAPKRIGRLMVVNGWGRLEPHTGRCFDARLILLRAGGPQAYAEAQSIFLYPADWIAEEEAQVAAQTRASIDHFPGIDNVEKRIAATRAFDILDRIGEIVSPLLAVAASDDILVPSIASARIVDGLSPFNGGTEVTMRWGGHACNVTDADNFNEFAPAWIAGEPLIEE
ncbi:pyrimidine utilization protein D [Sphingomonas crusticola]|uniref:pyrimidine utilization protein D n=1 Tax=Sphingomonas crusticola TaxID=1697973 RepID=UPI000E284A5C|nr:pyrimidine utilization protein D [Sphingomonas crusticola]